MKKMTFKVIVDVPDGATEEEVADYIRTEVEAGGGNRDPLDVLFPKKNTRVSHVSTKW